MDQLRNDDISQEESEKIKYELWSTPADADFTEAAPGRSIVAEGDSWFDYMPGFDILDHLKGTFHYEIFKVAEGGDSLENMVYGTEYGSNFSRKTPPIKTTLDAILEHKPRVFLFSGGGNDFAGPELEAFLNHKSAKLGSSLREQYVDYVFGQVVPKAYTDLIAAVRQAKPDIGIVFHGYGYPVPDGRSVKILGFRFSGPWLRPALTKKNYIEASEAKQIMVDLVDRFNVAIAAVANAHQNVRYIDLRSTISDGDWVNELHLKNSAYARVAAEFDAAIRLFM